MENLQLLSADTLAEALQNYSNFNDGEWYYAFCADYDQIDARRLLPADRPGASRPRTTCATPCSTPSTCTG